MTDTTGQWSLREGRISKGISMLVLVYCLVYCPSFLTKLQQFYTGLVGVSCVHVQLTHQPWIWGGLYSESLYLHSKAPSFLGFFSQWQPWPPLTPLASDSEDFPMSSYHPLRINWTVVLGANTHKCGLHSLKFIAFKDWSLFYVLCDLGHFHFNKQSFCYVFVQNL